MNDIRKLMEAVADLFDESETIDAPRTSTDDFESVRKYLSNNGWKRRPKNDHTDIFTKQVDQTQHLVNSSVDSRYGHYWTHSYKSPDRSLWAGDGVGYHSLIKHLQTSLNENLNECCSESGYEQSDVNGRCDECGSPTVDGQAVDDCSYSPTVCDACNWSPCDGGC